METQTQDPLTHSPRHLGHQVGTDTGLQVHRQADVNIETLVCSSVPLDSDSIAVSEGNPSPAFVHVVGDVDHL